MQTLNTFYQSKDWVKLTKAIKASRTNADGFMVCERCGRPIVKAYDAICHHKIFLTDANVNDAGISLNPDNIALLHARCHNYEHDKLGYKRREVYLIYGSPLSGKSTYAAGLKDEGGLYLDIDCIWQSLTRGNKYIKPKAITPVVFGIRDYILDCIKTRRGTWNNAYIIGGYPLISERERLCRIYGAREIYIDTDKEECIRRLHDDPDGRDIEAWTGYINEWWRRYRPTTPDV